MRWFLNTNFSNFPSVLCLLFIVFNICHTATLKDILLDDKKLIRIPREDKLYLDRYGNQASSESLLNTRLIKPEENIDDPRGQSETNLGKRCIRCEGRYPDDPYDRRGGHDSYYRGRDRYDDRYDDPRDRYYDRRYDPYDRYERDRYYDRYDQRRDYYDRDRDRDRDRVYDRGIGYDNRGYDYRDYWDNYNRGDRGDRYRDYYRPSYYDDRDDLSGRDYDRRPYYDYYGSGYANRWQYRDDPYRDRDRYGDDRYKYRDPYGDGYGYRPTSYLYGRPSTTSFHSTTVNPTKTSDSTESTNSG